MDLKTLGTGARLTLVADWVDGKLDPAIANQVAQAAADNPDWAGDAAWVRGLCRAGTNHPLPEPPLVLRQRLRQGFHRWARDHAAPGDRILTVRASLIFDSRRDQLELQTRGQESEPPIHLVFRSELADLVLEARWAGAHRLRLAGQVLLGHATSSPVFEAVIDGPDDQVRAVNGDRFGRFSTEVSDSVDRLSVTNGEVTIVAALSLRRLST